MKRTTMMAAVLAGLGMILTNTRAEEAKTPAMDAYTGDLLQRSTFTGDWGGMRSKMADKGVTFDASLTQVGQGVVNGGKSSDWEYGGRYNLTTKLDTQKMGLWPGGFAEVELEGNYDRSANGYTGALMPVSSSQVYPLPSNGSENFAVPNVSVMQFLSHHIGLYAGKLETVATGDMNEFAHGKGDTQFMNLAFNINPALLVTVPYSTLGTGIIILPTGDPAAAIINAGVLSSKGRATTTGFDDISGDNLTFAGEGRMRTDFLGHTGHQLVGVTYSDREFTSLDQSLRFIIENGGAIEKKSGSWAAYYNFDQYLYEPKKGSGQGLGVFGRFGTSDGNPNPMNYFYSIGLGGKGLIESRPKDQCGIGYYFLDIRSPTFTGPLASTSFLRDEWGIETYYNFAITPWMQLTPDLQVVRPAQKQRLSTGQSVDTATIASIRLNLIF